MINEDSELESSTSAEQLEIEKEINNQQTAPTWSRTTRSIEYTNYPNTTRCIPKRN